MFILKHNDQIIESFDEKIDMFKNVFFSALSFVDLNDISRSFYLNSIEYSSCIIENKVLMIIKQFALDKISNLDEFTNKLLKACASIIIKLLISLFETCIQQIYYSKAYKEVNTITLKKSEKKDYTISKSYRLIILLNIIDKIMKSIMSKKIAWLAKTHRLLLDTHMKCRKNKSIETTLEMLIEQIHIVWSKNTNRVVILLSLNVVDAFDMISHDRLIHDLRKWKISMWIINWMNNFL
jgi:hypothetical protein